MQYKLQPRKEQEQLNVLMNLGHSATRYPSALALKPTPQTPQQPWCRARAKVKPAHQHVHQTAQLLLQPHCIAKAHGITWCWLLDCYW